MLILEEAIISGFISKVINDCVDVTKSAIKKADNNRRMKNQSIQSRIYQVMIDVLNQVTNNQYKKQDVIYDIAEKLLKDFQNGGNDNIEIIQSSFDIFPLNIDNDKYKKFFELLYHELSKENNFDLYKEILLFLLNQKNKYDYDEMTQIKNKLDEVIQILNEKKDIEKINVVLNVEFQNDKKKDYIENWNSRLFLHQDTDMEPITLADAFITPDYRIYKDIKEIGFSEDDTLDKIIEKFIRYNKTSTMLITGVPGIGKSTITSWIANEYKDDNRVIILRFRDWESEELEKGLLKL